MFTLCSCPQLKKLNDKFGEDFVPPGHARLGCQKTDEAGRIYIPGAMQRSTGRILNMWKTKASDEDYNWWPARANELGIKHITVSGTDETRARTALFDMSISQQLLCPLLSLSFFSTSGFRTAGWSFEDNVGIVPQSIPSRASSQV